MALIECVPNFSEGRRTEVVEAIKSAIAAVDGVVVLDVSMDASHNRSVITFVAPRDRAADAAFAGMRIAAEQIDLTTHQGAHPRIGATDVVPFVPLEGATMDDCVALAHALGARVARELHIPVYLYERAATRPERTNLADVRRGEFEGLRDEIQRNADRRPDYGETRVHPTAGATAIGARPFLVAYNVYLGAASHLAVAKEVAKVVRASSGGLPGVKALGLEVDGQAQVSMNLVDLDKTSLHEAFDAVQAAALERGVAATWSEIVGLVPERALVAAGARHILLRGDPASMILERRVRDALASQTTPSMTSFVASVAAATPAPGGGSVAAHAAALAAALVQMVSGLTVGRKKYAAVESEMQHVKEQAESLGSTLSDLVQRDADAYTAVSEAYKIPKDSPERAAAVTAALIGAAIVPLETARACAAVAELALVVAERGNQNALSDAGVGALLAEAACKGAAFNVKINIAALPDRTSGAAMVQEAHALVERTSSLARKVESLVEHAVA
ncbi:MAG TPA: glutamate formimidoyltransferase [Gemmatimonadaceae bacterium]|nr:glutamate formimidoyltransferase [Gemmatimonadaceae bacterium]